MKQFTQYISMKTIVRLVTISLLLVVGVGNVWGTTAYTYDFSSCAAAAGGSAVTNWYSDNTCETNILTRNSGSNNISESTDLVTIYYQDAKISSTAFTVAASSTSNYVGFMAAATTALIMGKNGAVMNLPTHSGEIITNVTITTGSGCSTNVKFSVYSSTNRADKTDADKTGAASTNYSFDIDEDYQSDALTVKVTNAYNLQISKIVITTEPAGDAITLDKNNVDASGSTSGSGMIAADATSLTSGFTAPTRTGYSVEGYYTTSGCTTKIATSAGALQSGITVDAVVWTNGSSQWKKGGAATFYTKWTPNPYTVTLNDNGGNGGSGSKIVTFNANTNMTSAVAIPTKKHYIFGGYWTSANSGATLDTKVIDSDGTWVASVSSYTDATPNWIKADNVTLYAKWTEHTYTNYRTTCCTELGFIGGNVEFTNPTTAVLTWNNLSHVHASTPYTIKYKTHDAGGYTTFDGSITNVAGKKTCTITGLSCNTSYDFKIEVTAADGYCDKDSVMEDKNSGKWTVNYTLTGITKSSGPDEGANVCGDYSAVFAVSTVAYELPANITVTIGGEAATAGDDYTWNNTTGALSIASAKITGTIAISIAGDLVGCVADPSIGAVSLSGTFNLGTVGVTVATSGTGANTCAWTDYGFVWGTSPNPTVSNNKVQVGNDGNATTWNGSLTSTFAVGTTYYYRAYGKNSNNEATYYYSTLDGTFTPRSVTFNSNGGSSVATVYVNSGGTISAPSAPTKTGYTFSKWQLSGADYNFSSAVNSNITLDAVWNAKTMTVTLDNQSATTAGAGSVTGTYAAGLPSIAANMPAKTGYTFQGYFASTGGSGTRYIKPDGTADANWDKEVATSIYAHWTANPYTITLNNEGADSGEEGTESISVTFNANTNLTSAITNPTKTGYRFDGYFTGTNGSGSQIIGSDGNVIASVASYTSATKQWIYADDVELHAKWTAVRTVTWSVDGDTWSSGVVDGNTYVINGEKVSALPTAPTSSDCDDAKVFMGWRATAIEGVSVSDPGSIFTTKAGSPAITANTTFYAVFADRSGGDNTLVTSTSELEGETPVQVYIYAEFVYSETTYGAVAKAYGTGNNIRATSGSVSSNKLTPGENACAYTIGKTTGTYAGYTFYDGSKYLKANSTSNNYMVGADAIGNDGYCEFSITITDGVCAIASTGNTSRGTMQFNPNSDTGDYTKALFSCYKEEDNTNRSNVKLFKKNPYVYSNYVTSCASCDADATYTNTTPTVSDIDCTSATLTMEEGLATVGSEGCHISDYGFVIGTSDNPAIGGVGVTKLQVGTSDPTIGEDFSYDATGLTKGTHYYIRAYAINRHGTAYSTSTNFWTKNVSSIAITTAPTKTNYIVGETFDATGMVVTATMASGATESVTSDVTYSTSALTAGASQNFAINYSLCETAKSVNQVINVYTLSVSEGTNPSYGDYAVSGAVITVTPGSQKTFSLATTNCSTRDNGNGTYTVINVTGNASVVINYRAAAQVKVYYKVDGTTITSLTQDVYESSQTTLPTASALSSAMSAQGMALPDELYPNFIGWSETEFAAQTADPTIVEGTPIINAEKNFYAVYSNVTKKKILPSNFSGDYASNAGAKTFDGVGYYVSNLCLSSSKIQFKSTPGYIYSTSALSYISKIEIADLDLVVNACSDNAGTVSGSAITPSGTGPYTYTFPANKQYFKVTGKGSTDKVSYIYIYYASSTVYYMTQFCTRYAITGATTGGTTVIVNGNNGGTLISSHNELCEGKNLTLSATVNTQYSFGEWKITKTGAEPEVDLTTDLLGANKTSLTPPAFSMPGYGITVSATIGEKTATAWSWTYNSATIPDPMILYVGEVKQLDVTYTPDASQLVSAQKNYSVDKESSVAQVSKMADYYKMRGAAGVTEETSTAVTFTLNSLSKVVNVTVKPLPSAAFEDNVHNAISTTVTATVSEGVVSLTKKTPTHADISPAPASGNNCEKNHLHLIGWIDGDWEPFINYINGGSRPSDDDITSATGYFYLPNADIDLSVKGGKTYYAVWGMVDE